MEFGYAGKILRVVLPGGDISEILHPYMLLDSLEEEGTPLGLQSFVEPYPFK